MNYKIILASLLIFSVNHPAAVAFCPQGNPRSTDYIRRQKPNRCEGIKLQPLSGNSLSLISIATRKLNNYGNTLKLQIPRIKNGKNPQVIVKSLDDNYHYQLDDLRLSDHRSSFRFIWDTYVLKRAKIPTKRLRAIGYYRFGSQKVYVPVTLAKSSGKYEFVFYSEDRVKFISFKIVPFQNKKKTVYRTSRTTAKRGESVFIWDGRKVAAGRYILKYVANIQRRNRPSDRIEREIVFAHNPNWLR